VAVQRVRLWRRLPLTDGRRGEPIRRPVSIHSFGRRSGM
jgi:hypothetical protein